MGLLSLYLKFMGHNLLVTHKQPMGLAGEKFQEAPVLSVIELAEIQLTSAAMAQILAAFDIEA
jgi:hypothetical protein